MFAACPVFEVCIFFPCFSGLWCIPTSLGNLGRPNDGWPNEEKLSGILYWLLLCALDCNWYKYILFSPNRMLESQRCSGYVQVRSSGLVWSTLFPRTYHLNSRLYAQFLMSRCLVSSYQRRFCPPAVGEGKCMGLDVSWEVLAFMIRIPVLSFRSVGNEFALSNVVE